MKFHIECDSIEELNSVAEFLVKQAKATSKTKGVQGTPIEEPTPVAQAMANVTAQIAKTDAAVSTAESMAMPTQQTPPLQPQQAATPTMTADGMYTMPMGQASGSPVPPQPQVPTTEPAPETYTFDEVSNYAVRVMGVCQDKLMIVMSEFQATALTEVQPAHYGHFVARLRQLSGVQI